MRTITLTEEMWQVLCHIIDDYDPEHLPIEMVDHFIDLEQVVDNAPVVASEPE